MAGGVTLQVRQISSYPLVAAAAGGDLVLMQPGGLGNPYASIDAPALVATALQGGPAMGVGYLAPADAVGSQIFAGSIVFPNPGGGPLYNLYYSSDGALSYWQNGIGAQLSFYNDSLLFQVAPAGIAGQPVGGVSTLLSLNAAGAMALPQGTLTVARDPGAALEVATMGWVGNNTVASFNGRRGVVQLTSGDIYGALCLDSCIATENWVLGQIQASITMLLANHPFVFGWNGRTGAVYLTLADITCVFFQPGQQPVTQTPPLTSNDYSIPNTAWVVSYIANEFAGGGSTLATQSWVLANTVNSFNGRMGPVTLTSSDVYDVGAAPLNSPAFSGIPTAPTAAIGQATGQIATTAFVQQAITNNTAGVSTFNTRSGDVVLESADITAAGGLTNPSANLTGNPTAPTQPPGTNLPVIATCEFVQAALAAGAVTSWNTRTGAVTLTLADITGVGGAPLVSPAFSSVPTAPTAAPGTNTVQLATTAFVTAAVTAAGGVSSFNGRTGAVDLIGNDISAAGGLVNPSVNLTGSPTATTATAGDNSTRIATTAFVTTALSSGAVSSFNTRTGAVTLQGADITAAGGALLASPAFTGAPTAPTAAPATNNTQIATTAYVTAAILADTTGVTSFNTRTGAVVLTTADITGAGGAPLASPSFTGVPLGPTAAPGTSTTQLATTAFVQNAIASSGVSSFNARTGAVTLIANDLSAAGGALLAGPTFTGVPAAPTAAPGTNTTQLATTAFVTAALAGYVTTAALNTALAGYLPLSGGTLTGALNGTTINTSGNLVVGGSTFPAGGSGSSQIAPYGTNQGYNWYTVTGGNLRFQATTTDPVYQFINGGSVIFSIASNGAITAPGGLTAGSSTFNLTSGQTVALNVFGQIICTQPAAVLQCNPQGGNNTGVVGFAGQAWNSMDAFAYNNASDPRLKKDMAQAPAGALAKVLAIPVKNFRWKEEDEAAPLHTGWDASEVQGVLGSAPAVRVGDDEAKTLSLNTAELLALLWQAVQELSAKVPA